MPSTGSAGSSPGVDEDGGAPLVEEAEELVEGRVAEVGAGVVGGTMPSAWSTSRACSASAIAPSTSGSVSVAKKPKRPGRSATTPAANSLTRRAQRRASVASPNQTPGVDTDRIEVAMRLRP